MTYARKSLRLYLANREYVALVPVYILGLMTGISVLVGVIIGVATGFPLAPDLQEGFRNNAGAIWCIPGFLVTLGATAVNRNFAMALAFGSTRRDFWLGTTLGLLLTSLVTALASTVFLAVEFATGHWFIGVHAFDVGVLGNGDYLVTFAVTFVLCALSTAGGSMFGTVYRAFGPGRTALVGVGAAVLLIGAVALAVWQRDVVWPWAVSWGVWSAVVVGAALAAVAALGSYAANRFATV